MFHILFNSDYYSILSKLVALNLGSTLHDKQQDSLSALNHNAEIGNSQLALKELPSQITVSYSRSSAKPY